MQRLSRTAHRTPQNVKKRTNHRRALIYWVTILSYFLFGCSKGNDCSNKPSSSLSAQEPHSPLDTLVYVENASDTVVLIKSSMKSETYIRSFCPSSCIMGGACPSIYQLTDKMLPYKNKDSFDFFVIKNTFAERTEDPTEVTAYIVKNQLFIHDYGSNNFASAPDMTLNGIKYSDVYLLKTNYESIIYFSGNEMIKWVNNDYRYVPGKPDSLEIVKR